MLLFQRARLSTVVSDSGHTSGWMGRYERAVRRSRKNPKLEQQQQVRGRIDAHLIDPVMGTHDYKQAEKRVHLHQDAFGETLGTEDMKKWMTAKQAAKIFDIRVDDIPGMTPEDIAQSYKSFINKNQGLSREGLVEAAAAAEVLMRYISTEVYHRQTKAHFAKIITEEREKLTNDFVNIWNEKAGYVMWLLAAFFFMASVLMVISWTYMIENHPHRSAQVHDRALRIFCDTFMVSHSDRREGEAYVEAKKSPDVYVDQTVMGSQSAGSGIHPHMQKGHTILPSADPLYEELVADAAENLHREQEKIAEIIGKR